MILPYSEYERLLSIVGPARSLAENVLATQDHLPEGWQATMRNKAGRICWIAAAVEGDKESHA